MLSTRLNQQDVIRSYTSKAGIYDLWAALTESKARDRALSVAGIQDGESILEVAVGTGVFFEEVVRRNPGGLNRGVDLTPAMLEKARRKIAGLNLKDTALMEGDAFNLPFEDNQFDLLVNGYMFDLMPEDQFDALIKEFSRVLKHGGRLLLINMAEARHWYQGVWQLLYRINPNWMGGCRGITLRPYLEKQGFTIQHDEHLSQLTFPSEVLLAVK